MNEWILISAIFIAILVIVVLIITLVVYKKKKEGEMREPNYQVFFFLGTLWITIGIVFMVTINLVIGIAFMGLGLSYMVVGLSNRDKWKKNE